MYSIYDANGFKGELGTNMTVYELQKALDGFLYLKKFFDEGYTIDIDKVKIDLKDFKANVPDHSNFVDVRNTLRTIMGNCKEIAVLSNDAD